MGLEKILYIKAIFSTLLIFLLIFKILIYYLSDVIIYISKIKNIDKNKIDYYVRSKEYSISGVIISTVMLSITIINIIVAVLFYSIETKHIADSFFKGLKESLKLSINSKYVPFILFTRNKKELIVNKHEVTFDKLKTRFGFIAFTLSKVLTSLICIALKLKILTITFKPTNIQYGCKEI